MPEDVKVINQRLVDHFGRFEDGRPNWKVVWSTDELEKRWVTHTPEGFELLHPQVMEVKKYLYAKDRYILEHLIGVDDFTHLNELAEKTSYEPLWTFEDANGNPLAPDWDVCKLLIEQVQINMLMAGRNPAIKPPVGFGNTPEDIHHRATQLMDELFGNDTKISDALGLDSAVGYGPRQRKDWLN